MPRNRMTIAQIRERITAKMKTRPVPITPDETRARIEIPMTFIDDRPLSPDELLIKDLRDMAASQRAAFERDNGRLPEDFRFTAERGADRLDELLLIIAQQPAFYDVALAAADLLAVPHGSGHLGTYVERHQRLSDAMTKLNEIVP